MDQLPHNDGTGGFANSSNLFADNHQHFNAYDTLFPSAGTDPYDHGWAVNPNSYQLPTSRAHAHSPSWASQHAVHGLQGSSHLGQSTGQPSQYARPVSQSPTPYGQIAYNGYNSNQNFQYQQSQPQYDPALLQSGHGQGLNYSTTNYQIPNAGTIAPHALQHDARSPVLVSRRDYQANPLQYRSNGMSNDMCVDQHKLISSIPAGADAGLFSIINFDRLSRATHTTRMGNFVNVGHEAMNWECNRAALPVYVPRKSRNELRGSAGSDAKLLAKIGKKSSKMQRIAAAPKTVQAANTASLNPSDKIKYEGESSSEEDSSSDEDESSYTSDDATETAPLPWKRPEKPVAATEYDTVQALWRGKRKSISADSIRNGLGDFWNIAKTIRDRWKADATAFEEAKNKNQKSQLPLLESRVKDQRDMIEAAFKAALKHGHRSIVEIMSESESLIYVCYQFLLDRFRAEDSNSPLPRTILQIMTMWTTLTEERLDKTYMTKLLGRFAKYGDAKTKYAVNKITANAATASKEAKAKAAAVSAKQANPAANKTESPTQRSVESIAGVKRPASTTAEGSAAKKVATGSVKPNGIRSTAKQTGVVRKTAGSTDATKSSVAAAAPPTKTKNVAAKPSGIFSSLSAAKKPGTSIAGKAAANGSTASKLAEKRATTAAPKSTFSFAETMANLAKPKEEKPTQPKPEKQLPPETAEEEAKRLRKESRRQLRVSFKREAELTEVRYFTHDPDEEIGHDASQMRDVSVVGGEGRMFKQQYKMKGADDEDEAAEQEEKSLVAFREPGPIAFSDVDTDQRARNYVQRGGGELEVESKERATRDYYDANNLIVFYTTPEDIPPNPREPSNPHSGEAVEIVIKFGSPPDHFATRARRKTNTHRGNDFGPEQQARTPNTSAPAIDFSQLSSLINQQPSMSQPSAPQQPPVTTTPDISSILASIQSSNPAQAMPPAPHMAGLPSSNFQQPPMMRPQQQQQPPPQQPTQPQIPTDLAFLLSQIGSQNGASQPPAMGSSGGGFGMPAAPPTNFGQLSTTSNAQWQRGAGRGHDNNNSNVASDRPNKSKWKYKTRTCQFWLNGTCQKGEACTYKHSE